MVSTEPLIGDPSKYLGGRSEFVLTFAAVGFLGFACAEMIYAFVANSLALLGDAAAMLVDALTYVMNLVAIRHARNGKRSKYVAVAGPFLSALALVAVMIYVLVDAIQELLAKNGHVDLMIVLAFGLANLFLDFLNLFLFVAFPEAYRAILTFTDPAVLEKDGGLNIRSALTHVMADTFRSVAVVISASLALAVSNISPAKSDAVGAIVVEIPVLMCFQMGFAVFRRVFGGDRGDDGSADERSEDDDASKRELDGAAHFRAPSPTASAVSSNTLSSNHQQDSSSLV